MDIMNSTAPMQEKNDNKENLKYDKLIKDNISPGLDSNTNKNDIRNQGKKLERNDNQGQASCSSFVNGFNNGFIIWDPS